MSLGLLLPAALAALGALLLPLLLHLARRSQQTLQPFAALRWLRRKPKPRRRIRFDEWPLLLLRLLLLALLAVWLARPVLWGAPDLRPWVAVVPGVDSAALSAQPLPDDARLHWLAPQWPALDVAASLPTASNVSINDASISSLLRQLDQQLPAGVPLTVIVPSILQGVDAQRPRLSRQVDWRVLPGAMPISVATAVRAPAVDLRQSPACAEDCAHGAAYLQAAFKAWQTPMPATGEAKTENTADRAVVASSASPNVPADLATLLFWWLPGAVPDEIWQWVKHGGTLVLPATARMPPAMTSEASAFMPVWSSEDGEPLLQAARWQRGRVLRFTRPLQPTRMPQLLDAGFPAALQRVLQPSGLAPSRVAADAFVPLTGIEPGKPAPRDLRDWLLPVILLLFALERWLATRRSRAVAP